MLAHLRAAVAAVESTGLPAALDPRDLNPPCAWVAGRRATDLVLDGTARTVHADVYVIVPDNGTLNALASLDEITPQVAAALLSHGIGVGDIAMDEGLNLPTGGGPMPAYRITVEI